jgi:uncharacterized phiE125 gp8 family phage protein
VIYDTDRVVQPAIEPLSIEQAKAMARIDHSMNDLVLPIWIKAARESAEHETGSCLITQTRRAELFDWPGDEDLFKVHPVQSVELSYWNGSSWTLVLAGPMAIRTPAGVRVARLLSSAYPSLPAWSGSRVRVDFVAGWGSTAADVPATALLYIGAMCAYWNTHPQAASELRIAESPFLARLLDPLRTFY